MSDAKITFRLSESHSELLRKNAKKAGISEHLLAREYVIAALADPEKPIKQDIYELSLSVQYLADKISTLESEVSGTTQAMAAGIEILLIHVGDVSPEVARDAVQKIFGFVAKEEDGDE